MMKIQHHMHVKKKHVVLFLFILFKVSAFAQGFRLPENLPSPRTPKDSLPYRLDPRFPSFDIVLRDSVKVFNTKDIQSGRPIALMLFNPDCHHCMEATDAIVRGMDSLKDVRFYMVSTVPNMGLMRKFYDEHKIGTCKNIEVFGGDYEFFFISHYGTFRVPSIVLYDADKKLLNILENRFTATDIYNVIHGPRTN
jgi:thiol-disulfide isomerase/thioredoxin